MAVSVKASTVAGMAVMDLLDRTRGATIYMHGVDDVEREQILGSLVEKGWTRSDSPGNNDGRGVRSPEGHNVVLWNRHG